MTLRAEYPRPQFEREAWQNLNGSWQFEFDDENTGLAEQWFDAGRSFSRTIEVPFAYQTPLSGIHDTSFHDWVWYKRNFSVDGGWKGKKGVAPFRGCGLSRCICERQIRGHA